MFWLRLYESVAQCPLPQWRADSNCIVFILTRIQVIIFIYILININCAALMITYNDVSS